MRTLREQILEDVMWLGSAAELSTGNERCVRQALNRVQRVRADLPDVEARLQTILHLPEEHE